MDRVRMYASKEHEELVVAMMKHQGMEDEAGIEVISAHGAPAKPH